MGGMSYSIHGALAEDRLKPLPRKKSLLDKLFARQRFDEPTQYEYNGITHIEAPPGLLSERIPKSFKQFLELEIPNPSLATKTFLAHLKDIPPTIYLRGKKKQGDSSTDWSIQIAFSGCAGMSEISAALGYHWCELWVDRKIDEICANILEDEGFTVNREHKDYPSESFISVGDQELELYAAFSITDENDVEFEIDQGYLEGDDDGGESLILKIKENYASLVEDGRCRCQLCHPSYVSITKISI